MIGQGELDYGNEAQVTAYTNLLNAKAVEAELNNGVKAAEKAADLVLKTFTANLGAEHPAVISWNTVASTANSATITTHAVAAPTAQDVTNTASALATVKGHASLQAKEVERLEGVYKAEVNKIEGQLDLAGDQFSAETEIKEGDGAQLVYWLQHNYPSYFQFVYNVDAKKLAIVKAQAQYDAVKAASPLNVKVAEAKTALEAAKAELEAAKAELNAAKAGVEEKPEVVVD